jgi:hypothetical protein
MFTYGHDLSTLLAAFLCVLGSKIYCDIENLPMHAKARRAIYDFTMKEDHSNKKITNQLDLLFQSGLQNVKEHMWTFCVDLL